MDNYLASGNLTDSTNFYFNLSFELLSGCQFSCKGCHVNKNAEAPFTDEMYFRLKRLMESVSEDSYKPFIAFINPTDFLSADNTVTALSDKRVVEILRHFKRLSFQTTYLNIERAVEIGKVLREHYSDMELEINILIEPDKIENIKYLNTLQRNQNIVHDVLDWPRPIRRFGIMNVFDYDSTRIAELLKDYDHMHKCVEHLFETTIDFNFSLGRKDNDLSNEEFLSAANRIKNLFNTAMVSQNKGDYLRFSFGRISDSLVERQYNWKGGDLYFSPLLYERYVSFTEPLKIETPECTVQELEKFEEEVVLSQYMNVGDKEECSDCPLLGSCVDRGILHLMDIYDVKECLVSRDAMFVVNTMGALPHGSS